MKPRLLLILLLRFCTYSNANIYVSTFNVNGRPPPGYLGNWLHLDTSCFPDLVVIGFVVLKNVFICAPHLSLQEMDLALGTYVIDSVTRQEEWLFVLQRTLPNFYVRVRVFIDAVGRVCACMCECVCVMNKHLHLQVECIRLIGIFLVVYMRKESKFRITDLHTAAMPTGFLKFGNKGGVGVSMQLNDTSLCFINSHLAAGNGELARRNQVRRLTQVD